MVADRNGDEILKFRFEEFERMDVRQKGETFQLHWFELNYSINPLNLN